MRRLNLVRPTELYQSFWNVARVSSERALLDKCDVVIGGWSFNANRFQTASLVRRLSRIRVYAGERQRTRLFQDRSANDDRYSHNLTVCGTGSGEGVEYPHPAFSGYLKFFEAHGDKNIGKRECDWEALFFAYLNLNRAIQAQDLGIGDAVHDVQWWDNNDYALAICERSMRRIREKLLAPADNILDRTSKRTAYALSRPAEQHFRDHIMAIFKLIRGELPVHRSRGAWSSEPTVTLKGLEVYWDFYDEQPILTVLAVKNILQSTAKKMIVRHFPEYRLEVGLEYDSASVMLYLVNGVSIRFYAKSETTVRFEVSYSQAAIKNAAKFSGVQSLTGSVHAVASVKRDAAARLNLILSVLRSSESDHRNHATVDELVAAVLGAAGGPQNGVSLLTRLAVHRRISPHPRAPDYPQLRALKKLGVLMNERRSPRGRNYVVTPRYERARGQLWSLYLIQRHARPDTKKLIIRKSTDK